MGASSDTRLLERDAELAALRGVLEGVETTGRIAILEGSAGIGKSALLAATVEQARELGLRVLTARGSELERDFAFGTIRELFEPVLAAAEANHRAALLEGAAGPAAWAIEADVDEREARAEAGFAVLHGIYWLAQNLAQGQPVLIAVDDVHWADIPSLRALNHLAKRIGDLPIALVIALRPAEPEAPVELLDQLRGAPDTVPITLGPLGALADAELVRAQFPGADDAFCGACHSQSAGNPFYLGELLRALAAAGLTGGADQAAEVEALAIPTIGERLAERIASLSGGATSLATAMAVLGDGGRLHDAQALADLDAEDAAGAAAALVRMEVLTGEDPFAFVHPLVRSSIEGALGPSESEAAHSAAAGVLRGRGARPEEIASHLQRVGPAGSLEVVEALRAAAREAMSRAAPDAAVAYLRRAVAEEAQEESPGELLYELAIAEKATRDPNVVADLQRALELAADPALRGRIATDLFEILIFAGQWEAGYEFAESTIAELGASNPEAVVEIEALWAGTTSWDSNAVGIFERRLPYLRELAKGDGWAAHAASMHLGAVAAVRGERERVMPLVETALWGGRLISERSAGSWAAGQGLLALTCMEELDRTESFCTDVLVEARLCGSLFGLLVGLCGLTWVSSRRGNLVAAETELRTAVDLASANELSLLALISNLYFGTDAIVERTSLQDVADVVESLELLPAFMATLNGAWVLESRGRLRLVRGETDAGIADLRAAGKIHRALGLGPTSSSWRSILALALGPEERAEAEELVAEELELARATELPRPIGIALRAQGVLEGGEAGIALLKESLSVLEGCEARLEQARTQVELGAALWREGRGDAAREQLQAGMELAHRCGADRLVERALEELRATGARPRRIAASGVDALTPSELRVAQLATAGHSNPEIAQELYLSLKTVEMHLSSTYAKLDVSGRGARGRLAEALSPSV